MSDTATPRLVCLGQFTLDDAVRWDGTVQMGSIGGDAPYAWLAARLWMNDVALVAPVGNDFPPGGLDDLRPHGVKTEDIAARNVPTIRSWVLYEQDGRRTWVLRSPPEDYYELSPRYTDIPKAYRAASHFHIAAMDMAAQEELVGSLKGPSTLISLDPQEDYIAGNEERLQALLGTVDIFLPSAIEVRQLTGHSDYERAARELTKIGPTIVTVKLGPDGVLVYRRGWDTVLHIVAFPTVVQDETGAGDAFCGGFMAGIACNYPLHKAASCGVVSASFAVESFSWKRLIQTAQEEAESRLLQYQDTYRISGDTFQ